MTPGELYIDGAFHAAKSGERRDVVNPANGQVIATVAEAGPEDVDAAVAAARRAFDEGTWPQLSGRERGAVLLKAAALFEQHREELAQLESLDTGKPITFARTIDLGDTIDHFTYYAGLADTIQGA